MMIVTVHFVHSVLLFLMATTVVNLTSIVGEWERDSVCVETRWAGLLTLT